MSRQFTRKSVWARLPRRSTSVRCLVRQCVFAAALLLAFAAFAQSEEEVPAEAPPEAPVDEVAPEEKGERPDLSEDLEIDAAGEAAVPTSGVEEIVITGEARASMVEDDTISVVGFDADVVILEGIKDIRDLSNFTPSLEIKSAFAASNPTIYIRGVGLDDFNANAASAVAIYQDDVYMQSPAGQLFQFFDVEGVEVLRGPQGTLYRNASAGAILINSKKPSEEFSSYLTGTYGNYDLIEVEGAIGGSLIPDYLSGRLSAAWGIRDGITKNRCGEQASEPDASKVPPPCNQTFGDGNRVVDPTITGRTNDMDYYAARGQLLLMAPIATSETEWLLNVHGAENRSRAYQYQHVGVVLDPDTEKPIRIGALDLSRYRDKDEGDPFAGDYNIDGPEDIALLGSNLKGTVLFGEEGYELHSITAYEWHDLFRVENTDGNPNFLLESEYTDSAWQFSQQLELEGPIGASKLGDGDWTLGVYYLQEDLDVVNFFMQSQGAELFQEYTQKMWNFASYGQFEYRIQPGCERVSCDFTILAGIRYNLEHKSFETSVRETPAGSQLRETLDGADDALWQGPSGELSLTWNFSESSNLYAKYSRGWKGGHFNGGATSIFDVITGVRPEIVDSYEGGLRSFWFDDRLMINLTAFYYDYQDLQVFIIEQTPLGYPIPKLANASDAEVYGVELDFSSEPITGMYLTLNAAWVESEYKEFVVSFTDRIRRPKPCRTCPPPDPPFFNIPREFDYTGNTLIASPRFSATGSIEYDIPLPWQVGRWGLGTLSPRFSFSWKDTLLYDACGGRGNRCNFDPGFFGQKPFWVFNAALTWSSPNEKITVTGWTRNLLDEHYKTQSFDVSRGLGLILDVYAEPRTYGVTATLAF